MRALVSACLIAGATFAQPGTLGSDTAIFSDVSIDAPPPR